MLDAFRYEINKSLVLRRNLNFGLIEFEVVQRENEAPPSESWRNMRTSLYL
jgi:hypothetical protein